MSKSHKRIRQASLVCITIIVGIVLGMWQIQPPRVDEASPAYPAYQRMMENLGQLAVEPHAGGSRQIEPVRARILAKIADMGLTPAVEDATYTATEYAEQMIKMDGYSTLADWWDNNRQWVEGNYGIHSAEDWFATKMGDSGTLPLKNILVKLDAQNTDRGVLFVSHYDGTKWGPGAADDMVSVCAMLEALREQSENSALQTDLYFLWTDGEENGLLGARRFVKDHLELKAQIDLVANFEARGNSGGLLLFQASPKAYALLRATSASNAKPIGFSFAATIYSMMPNNTDFTAFLDAGYPGINFAAIEGVANYHQMTDSVENLNRSTAWQYLQTVRALSNYTANHSTNDIRVASPEAVYFPFLPGAMVLMSDGASVLLCAVACLLALAFLVWQAKNKRLRFSFSVVVMGLLILLSILCTILFPSGSYLLYLPLLGISITAFMKSWHSAHVVAKMLVGIMALLLWVPAFALLWASMIQPMLMQ